MDIVKKEIVKHNISAIVSLPVWTNLLYTSLKNEKLPSLKYVGCGGDVIPQAMADRILDGSPRVTFFNFYGPTETTVLSLCYKYPFLKIHLKKY